VLLVAQMWYSPRYEVADWFSFAVLSTANEKEKQISALSVPLR
jgi:hypothetical protein